MINNDVNFLAKEIWKDIPWYDGKYQVSNTGKVKNLIFNTKYLKTYKRERILKNRMNWWYYKVILYNNWNKKSFLVHRLIADAFVKKIDNKNYINHKNWIRNDNSIENLEWVTQRENIIHKFKILKCKVKWVNINQYDLQGNFIKTWLSSMDIKRYLWLDASWIIKCCKWKRKISGWFIFKYSN